MTTTVDVVTVTPNPAIDWTLTVSRFTPGDVNRVERQQTRPAGEGVNVAATLADAGYRVAATGWLGADNADEFDHFLAARGIVDQFVRVPGEIRLGIRITDSSGQPTTGVDFPGVAPPMAERSLLMERVLGLAAEKRWVVMAGSLPPGVDPGFYCELATLVTGVGARVLIDASDEPLRRALRSEPHILKPNIHELEALVGRQLRAREEIVSAARGLLKGEMELVAVSLGAKGAFFVTGDRALLTKSGSAPLRSTVGASDAMVAGIVAARLRGLALEETARLASAFALAAITGEPADACAALVTVSEAD